MKYTNTGIVEAFNKGRTDGKTGNIFIEDNTIYSYGRHFPLAIRMKDWFLINGDKYSVTTSGHTGYCISKLQPNIQISFSALRSAGIEPTEIKLIDNLKDTWEKVEYKDKETGETKTREVHHLATCLFKANSKHYLSGFDDQESYRRNSYFLTELNKPYKTVKKAIEGFKTPEVTKAFKDGLDVKRQGEWFFIPCEKIKTRDLKKTQSKFWIKDGTHTAREVRRNKDNLIFVRGTVRHTNGQHKMLNLGNTWHRVAKNTAVNSWQADGGID